MAKNANKNEIAFQQDNKYMDENDKSDLLAKAKEMIENGLI